MLEIMVELELSTEGLCNNKYVSDGDDRGVLPRMRWSQYVVWPDEKLRVQSSAVL